MAKLFSTVLFSFFLLFQTTLKAEEENNSTQITAQESEASEVNESDTPDEQEEQEPKEELSELEKEALAAEEAELREAGMHEEDITH